MALKPVRNEDPKPVSIAICEGVRQELVLYGRATDPNNGRVLVKDENGTVRYAD